MCLSFKIHSYEHPPVAYECIKRVSPDITKINLKFKTKEK